MNDVTQILAQLDERHPTAAEHLFALVYDELRRLAAAKLAHEKPGQTLQATALVHEAYVRLVGAEQPQNWNSRNHFFAAAAESMRRILVDAARRKAALKHGGDHGRQTLSDSEIATAAPPDEVLAVHEALDRLTAEDTVAGELVKLHYFGGFALEEAADLLGISRATAYRRWTYARTWLRAAFEDEPPTPSPPGRGPG
ncbi:MAG: ECF-type sigma factor [Pirellulales bacterium]